MRGHIVRRGKSSWRIKFDIDASVGKRQTRYVTVRGKRQDAERELAKLIASAGASSYVEPSKVAVRDFVLARVDQWEAAGEISARTAQRYRQLTEHQIVPHLGNKVLQKLTRLDVEAWHTTLRNDGLAPRTIGHAHRVLGKALSDAERDGMVVRNVCKLQKAPRVIAQEMAIVRDVPAFVEKLRDSPSRSLPCSAFCAVCVWARYWPCAGTASISTAKSFRSARRWSKPRRMAFGSRCPSPRLDAATSRCPTAWSTHCELTAVASSN